LNKIVLSLLTVLVINCFSGSAVAWNLWGDNSPLLTVNGTSYQITDYINWWHEWRDTDELPQTADAYIDWLLLSAEAEQMQLQDKLHYQDKIATFLKVRSLMMLKKEEVDDKIDHADDKELHKIYLRDYVPHWQLRTITFTEHANLNLFLKACTEFPERSTEEILSNLDLPEQQHILSSVVWERPNNLPKQILELLQQSMNQRFSAPYPWNNTWQIIEIITTEPASDEDFSKLRNTIAVNNLKKQQAQLTAKLMERLREKYPVKINQELLDAINFDGVAENRGQETVLELLSHKITAIQLYTAAKRQFDSFAPQQKKSTAFQRVLHQVINGIITQNLTNTEALSRNYQLQPPLKTTFDFYCKHRLIRELEQQLIAPAAKLSAEEIKNAYEKRKQQLAGPTTVEIIRAQTSDEQLANRLRKKMRQGEDFLSIISVLGSTQPRIESVEVEQLSTPLQQALQYMHSGESKVVNEQDFITFVQLIKAQHQQIVTFEQIKNELRAQLQQQAMRKKRQEIVQQLRQRSTIKLNQKQWQNCLDQLKKEK